MLTLTAKTLVEVVDGELLFGLEAAMVNGLATDSRHVEPGAAFVALAGERADGHEFLHEAILMGARALLVTRSTEQIAEDLEHARERDVVVVRVADALSAVQSLASYHRSRLFCPVIGVTGSTGKTTTKDFLASVMATCCRVVATEGNQNNELGVPLTVLGAGADTDVLIVEMAMRGAGQIARSCEIARPTMGLITNVGTSHIELLGSQEAIVDAKSELAAAIPEGGSVFLNGDDAFSSVLGERTSADVVTYGLGPSCDVRAENVAVDGDSRASFDLVAGETRAGVKLGVPGRHNVYNALAAAAIGFGLGMAATEIVDGLESATAGEMRMQTFQSASGIHVINDAYNANPSSMRAAVETLAEMGTTGKRVAVLGDMAELGSLTELAHFRIGEEVARLPIDILVTVGVKARRIADGARAEGMADHQVRPCAVAEEASEVLDDLLAPGDVVLVKASRIMGLERVVEGIVEPRV